MFSARNTESPNPFRPALQYLLSSKLRPTRGPRLEQDGVIDLEEEEKEHFLDKMSIVQASSSNIPMLDLPRPPAQFPTRTSSAIPYADGGFTPGSESEDEEYDHWGNPASKEAFQSYRQGIRDEEYTTLWRELTQDGGLGEWLFKSTFGWKFFIAILSAVLVGCSVGVVLLNRTIMWSGYLHDNWTSHTQLLTMIAGTYRYPYSISLMFLELVLIHGMLVLSACFTRCCSSWFVNAGLSGAVAPSLPLRSANTSDGPGRRTGICADLAEALCLGSSGIAGGGIFEFESAAARKVLPLAIISVGKVVATNYLHKGLRIPDFFLSQAASIPLAVLIAAVSNSQKRLIATLLSAGLATIGLAIASYRLNSHLTGESITMGLLSSLLVALYPTQMQRTYQSLLEAIVSPSKHADHDHANRHVNGSSSSMPKPASGDASGSREETRAYWRLLHYTSALSILLFFPILFLSGEAQQIWHNPRVLDVYFPRALLFWAVLVSWAVLWSTAALARAASPLTTAFTFVPTAAVLLCLTSKFRLPPGPWVGLGLCWFSCACFVATRSRTMKRFGNSGCC